jgi:hypothetical protein
MFKQNNCKNSLQCFKTGTKGRFRGEKLGKIYYSEKYKNKCFKLK